MQKGDNRPIGIFDSGIGGLTVLKEVWKWLPKENTIYFGDSGRMPYGTKSHDTIVDFSLQITRFLESKNVKLLVIACNSASAHSYEAVKNSTSIPVVEVITPGAQKAVEETRNGKIGVIATRATVTSGLYKEVMETEKRKALSKHQNEKALLHFSVTQKACPLFVSLAEEGWWDHQITRLTAEEYLKEMTKENIDTLVLGCTHYPLLTDVIQSVMGEKTKLINAGESVAKRVLEILRAKGIENDGNTPSEKLFFTSDDPLMFESQAAPFLGGGRPEGTKKIHIEEYG